MSRTILRPATAGDVDALATIWYDGWQDAHRALVPEELSRIRTRERFAQRLTDNLDELIVATVDDGPVGFVMLYDDELYQFFVAATGRGTDVATRLMRAAEQMLRERGYPQAHLFCAVGNMRAAAFYEKCRWVNVAELELSVGDDDTEIPVPVWRYEKALI